MSTSKAETENHLRAHNPPKILYDTEFRRRVYNHIAKYAKADDLQAWFHLVLATVILIACFVCAAKVPLNTVWGALAFLALVLFGGGVRVRMFIFFHDMAHNSFFSSSALNSFVAPFAGMVDFTPYSGWKHGHDYHHRHSNKTDRKQYAQTAPWDIDQFSKAPMWLKFLYSFVYNKYCLFTLTPLLYFALYNRITSLWYENMLQALWIAAIWNPIFCGPQVILYDVLSGWIAVASGVFLFHVQHTFEGSYKADSKEYDRFLNGMVGSSFLEVPWFFKYFTGAIEYHNIHHLNTKVPFYKLQQCWEDGYDEFFKGTVSRLDIWEAFSTVPYSVRNDAELAFFDVTHLWNTKSVF